MLNKKIAFIGPGAMAEALIAGLLRKKLAKPENLTAAGPREERLAELNKKYGIKTGTPVWEALQLCPKLELVEADQGPDRVRAQGLKETRPAAGARAGSSTRRPSVPPRRARCGPATARRPRGRSAR